jgi:hypothetical protein
MSSQPQTGMEEPVDAACKLDSETAAVEFKSAFNPADKGEFLEILKDIAAMANSGGGTIVFGLLNDGTPSGADLTAVASLDPAKVTDAIYKYSDCQFQAFRIKKMPTGNPAIFGIIKGLRQRSLPRRHRSAGSLRGCP